MTETPQQRSAIMRAVRSADTAPEMLVRRLAHSLGYRFRLHRADLPGKPDLVFPARRKAIFVHGCFWHGHTCARGARMPVRNREYWQRKIARNSERDGRTGRALRAIGWRRLVIWECETRKLEALKRRIRRFLGPAGGAACA